MHVSRCIIRDAELIAFEWGWMDAVFDGCVWDGGQNRKQNVERHESHSRAARSLSRRRLGLHSDKHI